MKKLLIGIMMFLMVVGFVSATQTYQQTATGWTIYDDFNDASLNTDIWTLRADCVKTATAIYCPSSGGDGGLIIENTSYMINPRGEWNVTVFVSGGNSNSYSNIVVKNTNLSGYEDDDSTMVYHRNDGTTLKGRFNHREYVNGTLIAFLNDTRVNGYQLAGKYFYQKINLPNGTYMYRAEKNDVYVWSSVSNHTMTDILPDEDWFFHWNTRGIASSLLTLDYINITYKAPPVGNFAPVVVVNAPANNTDTNQNLSVQVTVTDDNNATTDCDLYVNTVLNQSNSSVLNNTLTSFPVSWSDGLNSFYVSCTDGEFNTSSGVYSLYFDEHEPNIVSGSPSILNSTVYTGYTMHFFGNVTNLNLTNVTRIIYYPNSTQFYVNETTSFVNSTFLGWDETFNTTFEPNGVWTYSIYAEDIVQNHSHYYSFTVNNCVPDWVCTGYESCPINDSASCDTVTDNNVCGLPFGTLGETYTDFTPQSCDYCDDNLDLLSYGTCDTILGYRLDDYQDLNFATCCNLTNTIPSDCPFGNVSEFGQTNESCNSQYISGYVVSDLTDVTIDGIFKFLFGFVTLAGIIAIVIVYRWGRVKLQ